MLIHALIVGLAGRCDSNVPRFASSVKKNSREPTYELRNAQIWDQDYTGSKAAKAHTVRSCGSEIARRPALPRWSKLRPAGAEGPREIAEASWMKNADRPGDQARVYITASPLTGMQAAHLSGACHGCLEQLVREGLIEQSMISSESKTRYRITDRGRQHAERSLEVCGYLGPRRLVWSVFRDAPLAICAHARGKAEHVAAALSVSSSRPRPRNCGPGGSSGRSLFIYGHRAMGNSVGRQVHAACRRLLDPVLHQRPQQRDPPL